MSREEDVVHDALERLEWDERKEEATPFKKMRQITRRTALTGSAAGIGALILQACGGSELQQLRARAAPAPPASPPRASAATGGQRGRGHLRREQGLQVHARQPRHHQPVLHPDAERRGRRLQAARAAPTSGPARRTATSVEMVSAFNSAVSAGVDGIGIALIEPAPRSTPATKALAAKIPVVAYNADAAGNARLAYIGQDLFVSGQEMGQHIAQLVPSGDVALFIATPGSLNIQPRIDGAQATLKSHPSIKPHVVATGAALTAGAVDDRRLHHRAPQLQGFLRRRRRQHPERRPDDPEAQPDRQGQGRRL